MTIDVEGNAQAVEWDTTNGTLKPLQRAVGGFVDVVSLHPTVDMWVNDNGIAEGLPVNIVATAIAGAFGATHQPYFGPVVFTGGADSEGETLSLEDRQVTLLLSLASTTAVIRDLGWSAEF
ncbi:DUF3846 domain-containing protein [Actinopolymorpha pittospori]|uniref:DUF3846 domain-containing protein n=1 Tax=Actinopolymorpha pittospori TaxID=648752 RepID=A0A927N0A6_9ACTN|nr:hypothetical protein [Actinopolymorpha pittospori]